MKHLLVHPVVLGLSLVTILSVAAPGQENLQLPLQRPGDREFILDTATMIAESDRQHIREICDKLLTDKAAPIIVVTIDSMANNGGPGLRIETYARLLFDQWGIGPAKIGNTAWNYGILLLVSRDDRKARIELGAGWRHDKDTVAQHIMDHDVIPRFRQGNFSAGILAGVRSLDSMARDLQPLPPSPASVVRENPGISILIAGLGLFTIVSLFRRGTSGWAWLFWGVVFAILGNILYHMARSRRSGGFSGGSFGGGFSGGGGATGSW